MAVNDIITPSANVISSMKSYNTKLRSVGPYLCCTIPCVAYCGQATHCGQAKHERDALHCSSYSVIMITIYKYTQDNWRRNVYNYV